MKALAFHTPTTKKENENLKHQLTEIIGERMKEIRKQKGMTQQELAEKAGLHLTYVGHLELGTFHPSVFVLWKIAQVLNVPLDSFVN